jgi:hypothetical protein
VCVECGRWNLTPFEERWEAIEDCGRLFEQAAVRATRGSISLARISDEIELVRVGAVSRRELTSWRYGNALGADFRKHWKGVERSRRREVRRRWLITGAASAALGVVAYASGPIGLGVATLPIIRALVVTRRRAESRLVSQIDDTDGWPVLIRAADVRRARIQGANDGIDIRLTMDSSDICLTGEDAVWALGLWLPWLNHRGVHRTSLLEAATIVEYAGSGEAFLQRIAASHRLGRKSDPPLGRWPGVLRMALEMAANGHIEHAASAGELKRLERAWKEADEIARIADALIEYGTLTATLARLKLLRPTAPGRP